MSSRVTGSPTYLADGRTCPFEPFEDFYDVERALEGAAVGAARTKPRAEDVARLTLGRPLHLPPQRFDCRTRDLVDRLLDGRERRVRPRGRVDPVEPDDRELIWDA